MTLMQKPARTRKGRNTSRKIATVEKPSRIRTLIVPDIHNDVQRVDAIIASLSGRFDQICFLGDYFDDFGDRPTDVEQVAGWLRASLEEPKRIHLLGNHDVAYLFPGDHTWCTGSTPEKMRAIRAVLDDARLDRLRAAFEIDGWLVSHAGFHPSMTGGLNGPELVAMADESLRVLATGAPHPLFAAGFARGGPAPFGGVTWLDFTEEFQPIGNLHQLVGHTPLRGGVRGYHVLGDGSWVKTIVERGQQPPPRYSRRQCASCNWCLDSRLEAVAIVDGAKIELVWTAEGGKWP